MSDPTDRFVVEIGHEDFANHIIDLDAGSAADTGPLEIPTTPRDLPGELMCSRGQRWPGAERIHLDDYAAHVGVDKTEFEDDSLEGICSYCWSNTIDTIAEQKEHTAAGVRGQIGEVGYRFRWKQKGRAREEWYDIVVRPDTTMEELDKLVRRFTTIRNLHVRMYGLEDEYMDSSIEVLPEEHYESAGFPSHTKASSITIGDIAERATLWEGDRLTMVNDLGTPSRYYCIVKEVYTPEEIKTLLTDHDPITTTETAAIIEQKRPQ